MGQTRREFLHLAAAACVNTATGGLASVPGRQVPLRFGVNYTPRRLWWYCWQDWNQQAILEDMEGIASLGVDHIRAQCLWPVFQPGINVVNQKAVDALALLLDAADRSGLDVEVTVLNGWMSGLSFLPAWCAPLASRQGDDGRQSIPCAGGSGSRTTAFPEAGHCDWHASALSRL